MYKKSQFSLIIISTGVILIANALVSTFCSNFHVGILLMYVLGAILIICGIISRYIICRTLKFLQYATSILCVCLTVFLLFLYTYGNKKNVTYTEDAVIVLGAGIQGEELSENLKYRLVDVVKYYAENPGVTIIVSGGQGPQEDITEALAMERYLIAQGIPQKKILKEEKATSTAENFQHSKTLLDDKFGLDYSVCFITSNYHVHRAINIAENFGFENIGYIGSTTPWYMCLPNGLRECLAVLKLWILD